MEWIKRSNKKFFTLIELIVVIVVLGILAAIVIPNISSFKEEATETAISSDARNIQTAVDMYGLDSNGATPTKEKATVGNPQIIEVYGLQHDYLRKAPTDKGAKFWLDANNTVWASMVDAPSKVVSMDNGNNIVTVSWDTVGGASLYKVYQSTNATLTSTASTKGLTLVDDVEAKDGVSPEVVLPKLDAGTYLITALDTFNLESAPTSVNTSYTGYGAGPSKDYVLTIPKIPKEIKEEPLYEFTSAVFTSANVSGRIGPTQEQLNSSYQGTSLENKVTSTNGIQLWTVPASGQYKIETYGAQGGNAVSRQGGKGSIISADIPLLKGQQLKILVGQQPLFTPYYSGGGGGGTFVTTLANEPIVIAGGGAGYSHPATENGYNGTTTNKGGDSKSGQLGGENGLGGTTKNPSTSGEGSAGGGLLGNGESQRHTGSTGTGGRSFINGGLGGVSWDIHSRGSDGGFGSGGGSGNYGSGGGGGYSGGAAGQSNGNSGGGGGSFVIDNAKNLSSSNGKYNTTNVINLNQWNNGNGKVIITYIEE